MRPGSGYWQIKLLAAAAFGMVHTTAQAPMADASTISTCARAKIRSHSDCKRIRVEFDLSECQDPQIVSPAEVTCHGDIPVSARVQTRRLEYSIGIVPGPEIWGEKSWELRGEIIFAPRKGVKSLALRDAPPSAQAQEPTQTQTLAGAPPPQVASLPEDQAHLAHDPIAPVPTAPLPGQERAPAAEAPPPAPAAPAPKPGGWDIAGTVDTYYAFNFNRPLAVDFSSGALPSAQNTYRNFDLYHNQLGLNLFELSLSRVGREVSFRADLDVGQIADFTHSGPSGSVDALSKYLGQAVLSYAPASIPGLSLSLGKMATHLGLEVTKAKDNWQYSRSFLYALALPYWHTGLQARYELLPEKLSASAFLYNGWNTLYEANSAKTWGWQLGWTPRSGLSINYNGISGPEQFRDNRIWRTVHELNLAWTLPNSWALAVDLATGREAAEAKWHAGTLAFKVPVTLRYWISPRFELYRDDGGFTTGATQTLHGLTLTQGFKLSEGLETRLELRGDGSDQAVFSGKNGLHETQRTVTLGILYSF